MSDPASAYPPDPAVTRRFVIACLILLFAGLIVLFRVAVLPDENLSLVYLAVITSALALANACHMFGWRSAIFLFLLCAVVGWTSEQLGIQYLQHTSAAYHYTNVLGPRLGHVPLVIPLSWYTSIYSAYVIANLIVKGQYEFRTPAWGATIALAFLSALVETSWDLSMDPYMVHKLNAWVWENGGPYFGIPFSNYFGWMLITFLVNLIYRRTNHMLPLVPQGHVSWKMCFFPLAGYAINMVGSVVAGYPEETRLIAFFAMGIPLSFAVVRLWFTNTGRG